jgi:hypothetical protein
MSTSKKIVWIDDNSGRKRTADDLDAEFLDVHGKDITRTIEELLNRAQPSLVLLDHILDKTTTTNPLYQRGSTIAEAIKERWPSCPVVGVTNADNEKTIDVRTRQTYDAFFPFSRFANYLEQIEAIKNGFAVLAKLKADSASDLVHLLNPPKDEVDRLVDALPGDLKKAFGDASLASRLYAWVDKLIDRPGFLYDTLWAATFIGLTESGFLKVSDNFDKGKYTGIFAWDDEPRWWSSRLAELLYKCSEVESGTMSWHLGRRLPGIKEEHHSRCYVCRKAYPETVAYLDSESNERRAMHLDCTVLHPAFKRELYFEDIRMMKGK